MTDTTVWLVTGAARGMGVDLAKAALAAGHSVVATARKEAKVTEALGEHEHLLSLSLDIIDPAAAKAAVDATIARFGRVDTLVNNAGTFQAGYFEEISDEAFRAQMETNFFGPLNVTRAVLPIMRKQRSGHVITFSSVAGLVGQDFTSAYSASKFALEGWMETLQHDLEPFGISTTIVEPGFFRTELLVEGASTVWADLSIDDYAERTKATITGWRKMNGQQGGDPAKLAAALVTIASLEQSRCAGWPARTRWPAPRARRGTWSPRLTPTAICPRTSTASSQAGSLAWIHRMSGSFCPVVCLK